MTLRKSQRKLHSRERKACFPDMEMVIAVSFHDDFDVLKITYPVAPQLSFTSILLSSHAKILCWKSLRFYFHCVKFQIVQNEFLREGGKKIYCLCFRISIFLGYSRFSVIELYVPHRRIQRQKKMLISYKEHK